MKDLSREVDKNFGKSKNIIPAERCFYQKTDLLPNLWPTYYSKSKGSKIWDLDKKNFSICL